MKNTKTIKFDQSQPMTTGTTGSYSEQLPDVSKYTKLQIGCGTQHYSNEDGWCNLDRSPACNPDIEWDITAGLPMFSDDTLDEVVANGVIEQVESNHNFVLVMNEIWRVLKYGAQFNGQVPSSDPRVLHYDPMDRRWFQKDSFNYFNVNEKAWKDFGKQYGFFPWIVLKNDVNDNGIINFRMLPAKEYNQLP